MVQFKTGTVCITCSVKINRSQKRVACGSCQKWLHRDCTVNSSTDPDVLVCVNCSKLKSNSRSRKRKKQSTEEDDEKENNNNVRDEASEKEDEEEEDGEFEEFTGYDDFDQEQSEFEKSRLENIKKNQEVFEQLGVGKAKSEVSASNKRRRTQAGMEVGGLRMKSERREKEILPPRPKSLRLQNKRPDTKPESFRYVPGYLMTDPADDPYYQRKPVLLDMECVNELAEEELVSVVEGWFDIKVVKPVKVKKEEAKEEGGGEGEGEADVKKEEDAEPKVEVKEEIEEVKEEGKPEIKKEENLEVKRPAKGRAKKEKKSEDISDMDRYQSYDKNLDVRVIAKVTKNRAFSLAWYPSETKRIIFQGDKKGYIGAWDMDRGTGKDSVFLFDVHAARPVGHLAFDPFDSAKLYSCDYDGTLTCGDFNQLQFMQKFAFDDMDKACISHFAWPKDTRNTLLCATSFGEVMNMDLNTGKPAQIFRIGQKLRCIDCHPLNSNMIVCANSNGALTTWDWRMLTEKSTPNHYISSFTCAKAITKAYFSPQTGNKILSTSQDHYIRILDVDQNGELKIRHPIAHRNYVGRWVTTFRSTWDPKTDSVFTCGSMNENRRVDLFGCNEATGKLQTSALYSENLQHITPLNVFHPHLDLLASVNSSGRICMWTMP